MKYLQLVSPGQKLEVLIRQGLTRMQNQFKAPFVSVLRESFYYVKERRADNPELFVKRKAVVSVLIPDSCMAQKPFRIREDYVAYEDGDIVIADKPVGIPTQATQVFGEDHLYGALIAHYTEKHPNRLAYVGMHHRIDRETSGLVLFTKKPSMNKSIAEQFRDHKITKKYLAVVTGEPPGEFWAVTAPIARLKTAGREFRFGVNHKQGEPAETKFAIVGELGKKKFLVECQPVTGRTHQIRVHLAHCGTPIVGDPLYGDVKAPRMMLHAYQLSLLHPKTGKPLEIKSMHQLPT